MCPAHFIQLGFGLVRVMLWLWLVIVYELGLESVSVNIFQRGICNFKLAGGMALLRSATNASGC